MRLARYKTNPFLEGMIVPVRERQVKMSRIGKDDDVLINQSTGEIKGTHVTTYRKVDSDQFVKIFTSKIGLAFDLSTAGVKLLTVLIWAVQNRALSKDELDLDSLTLQEFCEFHKAAKAEGEAEGEKKKKEKDLSLSLATFRRGLNDLETAKIIAKTMRSGRYFINPNFIFNGDRIAFTTVIERKRNRDPNTIDMFENLLPENQ